MWSSVAEMANQFGPHGEGGAHVVGLHGSDLQPQRLVESDAALEQIDERGIYQRLFLR